MDQVEDGSDAVKGDFNALSLLEYHLVANSAKFTEKGQVRPVLRDEVSETSEASSCSLVAKHEGSFQLW